MKFLKQSFEIINQTDFSLVEIKKHIERCARVSYKSENRIINDSYEKFVAMLFKLGHYRPLEFGTVHLNMSISDFHNMRDSLVIGKKWNNIWIDYKFVGDRVYVTTNFLYYLRICEYLEYIKNFFDSEANEYYPKRYTVHMILNRGVMDK